MNFRSITTALALCTVLFSCAKKEELVVVAPPTDDKGPYIPAGDLIRIHFGTSTQMGCMYSFSNCIWIGWGAQAINFDGRLALEFEQGDAAGQYFGHYFPLTADFVVDAATAKTLGIAEQVIPAGFYPLRDAASGQATGKRMVVFQPEGALPLAPLPNPNNPQDNIGQLHNLAVQVVLHQNRSALESLNGDRDNTRRLVSEKTIQFMAEAELPLSSTEQQRLAATELYRDYGNYAARLAETRLSAADKKALLAVFDEAAALPVRSTEDLGQFVRLLTERENQLAQNSSLDNPRLVLSMVSVLKYSRYYWFWKSISSPESGSGTAPSSKIPDWVWADIIGMELGGPVGSALASSLVYMDQR